MRLTHEGELHGRVDEEHLLLLRHLRLFFSSGLVLSGSVAGETHPTNPRKDPLPSEDTGSKRDIRDCTAIRGQLTPQLNQRGGAAGANKDRGGGEQGRAGTAEGGGGERRGA